MKNWEKCEADVVKLLSKHYTKGRSGRRIEYIVEHYNAGNLTVEGCWSVWQTRQASAHYQVEDDGRIGQLVYDSNTAWHASNWDANCKSIGIEHANMSDGTITEATLDNGAHLTAALCHLYGLGRPQWLKNVFPHKHFAATSCPGQIYGSQKQAYIERAQYWYDKMAGKDVEKPSSSGSTSKPSTGSSSAPRPGQYTDASFAGTYRCTVNGLRIRKSPSLSGAIDGGATYDAGETVVLDGWYAIADGWVWGRYTTYSGATRYVAVGRATGKVESDDYLVKVSGSKSSGSSSSKSWNVGAKVRVTNPYDEHGTHLAVSGTYDIIQIDGDRVVIGRGGAVTAACPKSNLALA